MHVRFLLSIAAVPATAALVQAQTFTILARDGDVVAGVGNVTAIDDLEVNDAGTWLVKVDTDFATTPGDGVVLVNGVQFSREADALVAPAGSAISSYGEIHLDDLGRASWNLFLSGTPSGMESGVFRDHQLILQESTLSTAPEFGGATPYTGFFGAKNDGAGSVLVVMASVDDPLVASTTDRAIVRWVLDGSGALVSETVVAKEGDTLGGVPVDVVVDFDTSRHEWSVNRSGQVLYLADMNGVTTSDGFLMLDGTLLVREGDPLPGSGRNWEFLLGRAIALNDSGEYAFRGNLDGATTDDELICKNNSVIVAQEGTSLPGTGGFTFTGFGSGPIGLSASGDVFWTGDWNDPDTTRDVGIFRNQELLVQEGVTDVNGFLVQSIPTVQDNFGISRDGRYLIFECVLAGLGDSAVLLDLGAQAVIPFCSGDGSVGPCPCGNNGAPGHGCASSVQANGALLETSGVPSQDTLVLEGSLMPVTSTCIYLQGDALESPAVVFGDGLRCTGGTLLRLRTRQNVGGASTFPDSTDTVTLAQRGGVIPGSGTIRYYQTYYRNAAALFCPPETFNVTNGVQVIW
jgi:hypothetical protein